MADYAEILDSKSGKFYYWRATDGHVSWTIPGTQWRKFKDNNTQNEYFFHIESKEVSWDVPADVTAKQAQEATPKSHSHHNSISHNSKLSSSANGSPLPAGITRENSRPQSNTSSENNTPRGLPGSFVLPARSINSSSIDNNNNPVPAVPPSLAHLLSENRISSTSLPGYVSATPPSDLRGTFARSNSTSAIALKKQEQQEKERRQGLYNLNTVSQSSKVIYSRGGTNSPGKQTNGAFRRRTEPPSPNTIVEPPSPSHTSQGSPSPRGHSQPGQAGQADYLKAIAHLKSRVSDLMAEKATLDRELTLKDQQLNILSDQLADISARQTENQSKDKAVQNLQELLKEERKKAEAESTKRQSAEQLSSQVNEQYHQLLINYKQVGEQLTAYYKRTLEQDEQLKARDQEKNSWQKQKAEMESNLSAKDQEIKQLRQQLESYTSGGRSMVRSREEIALGAFPPSSPAPSVQFAYEPPIAPPDARPPPGPPPSDLYAPNPPPLPPGGIPPSMSPPPGAVPPPTFPLSLTKQHSSPSVGSNLSSSSPPRIPSRAMSSPALDLESSGGGGMTLQEQIMAKKKLRSKDKVKPLNPKSPSASANSPPDMGSLMGQIGSVKLKKRTPRANDKDKEKEEEQVDNGLFRSVLKPASARSRAMSDQHTASSQNTSPTKPPSGVKRIASDVSLPTATPPHGVQSTNTHGSPSWEVRKISPSKLAYPPTIISAEKEIVFCPTCRSPCKHQPEKTFSDPCACSHFLQMHKFGDDAISAIEERVKERAEEEAKAEKLNAAKGRIKASIPKPGEGSGKMERDPNKTYVPCEKYEKPNFGKFCKACQKLKTNHTPEALVAGGDGDDESALSTSPEEQVKRDAQERAKQREEAKRAKALAKLEEEALEEGARRRAAKQAKIHAKLLNGRSSLTSLPEDAAGPRNSNPDQLQLARLALSPLQVGDKLPPPPPPPDSPRGGSEDSNDVLISNGSGQYYDLQQLGGSEDSNDVLISNGSGQYYDLQQLGSLQGGMLPPPPPPGDPQAGKGYRKRHSIWVPPPLPPGIIAPPPPPD